MKVKFLTSVSIVYNNSVHQYVADDIADIPDQIAKSLARAKQVQLIDNADAEEEAVKIVNRPQRKRKAVK